MFKHIYKCFYYLLTWYNSVKEVEFDA